MKEKNSLSKNLFWDTDVENLDYQKDSNFIIARILEHGDKNDVKWLLQHFKISQIRQVIAKRKDFSPKSVTYWASIFNVPKNKILCLKKSYQKMRKNHWPY